MEKEEIKNKIFKTIGSKLVRQIIFIIGAGIIALLMFCIGVFVGVHWEKFDKDWGDHYFENFGRPHTGLPGTMGQSGNAFGATGKILSVNLPVISVQDSDGKEKIIVISDDTDFQIGRQEVDSSSLIPGINIVVIGSPNPQGQIDAKFIRIFGMNSPI